MDSQTARVDARSGADRRTQIVEAARSLYEEKGLTRTSVMDIAKRVGVSRTLFYHYFPGKDAVTSAVLDTYVEDFLESARIWNEGRTPGNIEDALDGAVGLLRMCLFDRDSFRIALANDENASLYIEFVNRVADAMATYIVATTVRDYEALHGLPIAHEYETFYTLIVGLVSFVRTHPDADDGLLKDLIAQTLHMQRGQAEKPFSPTRF
jgi:AcrR family transcriptional regulator